MSKIIEKYRKEAYDLYNGSYRKHPTWRQAILEAMFRPKFVIASGKKPMDMLHPQIDKLHLPHGMYMADWRKYRVEDHPALVNFQKRCHAAGLHDPWLRNFAWQFYPNSMVHRSRFAFITQRCLLGFAVGAALFACKNIYRHYYPEDYQHSREYMEKHGHHH